MYVEVYGCTECLYSAFCIAVQKLVCSGGVLSLRTLSRALYIQWFVSTILVQKQPFESNHHCLYVSSIS